MSNNFFRNSPDRANRTEPTVRVAALKTVVQMAANEEKVPYSFIHIKMCKHTCMYSNNRLKNSEVRKNQDTLTVLQVHTLTYIFVGSMLNFSQYKNLNNNIIPYYFILIYKTFNVNTHTMSLIWQFTLFQANFTPTTWNLTDLPFELRQICNRCICGMNSHVFHVSSTLRLHFQQNNQFLMVTNRRREH